MGTVRMRDEELERVLGDNVRRLRARRRLTQVELADAANVSVGALKHLEGGAGATTTTLVKVVRALGRQEWIDTLGPGPAPFNPLELLEFRKHERKREARTMRVRHGKEDLAH